MNRSTLLLLAFLIVLGGIVLLVLPSDEDRMASYDRASAAFSIDSAGVVKISVERPGRTITVENVGGRWLITSHGDLPADPARVAELTGGFSRFRTGSLVSSNPAKQQVFQVDSSGSLVTITERSGASRSIVVGKMGPSFSEVYFRLPGENDVYLGSGVTAWSLERDVKDWRDRTIFAAPAEAITGVTITTGGRERRYDRDSSGWTSGGSPVPSETITPILTALSGIRADEFIDSAVSFSGTPSTVEVDGSIRGAFEFYRMAGDTNRYAVRAAGADRGYVVGRHTASQLFGASTRPSGSASVTGAPAVAGRGRVPAEQDVDAASAEERRAPAGRDAATPPPETSPVRVPAGTPRTATPAETRGTETGGTETRRTGTVAQPPPSGGTQSGGAGGSTPVNPFRQRPAEERRAGGEQAPPTGGGTRTGAGTQTGAGATGAPTRDAATPPAGRTPVQTPAQTPAPTPLKSPVGTPSPVSGRAATPSQGGADEEGELTVHVVKAGQTMTSIAKDYGVSVEQILKWNLLKSISVRPGQELYIFVRK